MPTSALLDDKQLTGLLDAAGGAPREILRVPAREFAVAARHTINTLREALALRNLSLVHAQAHQLRGSAANFGLVRLSALAGKVQDVTAKGAPPAEVDVSALHVEVETGILALLSWIDEEGAPAGTTKRDA